jgi:hypothetical protein
VVIVTFAQNTTKKSPVVPWKIMEMAHPLVPRLEITPAIPARGKTGRGFREIQIVGC